MKTFWSLALFLSFSFAFYGQERDSIVRAFEDYSTAPREVAYLHLNKSTYIKGENIGFTAYVFDKKTKKNALLTTNLYVSIEDGNKNIIKRELLKLDNGVVSNVIKLDSSFTSGYYTIKAYTNWMRNFDQQDYFTENIRVIDPSVEEYIETSYVENSIDIQFLPESGHLVDHVRNSVGVVIKDIKGYGVPEIQGKVYENDTNLVSEFKVNHLGIGKFLLYAQLGQQYAVKFNYLNKDYSFNINTRIEPVGITLSVVEFKDKALVKISTNEKSLKLLKDKPYKLTLHNGNAIDAIDISFKDAFSITKSYNLSDIGVGVNIFTLFNENNQPVAERLFFNYRGLDMIKTPSVTAKATTDSINLKLKFDKIDPEKFNTLSVSVLPSSTESYHRQNNILNSNFLKPYIKGSIENASYYFKDITERTKFDMDKLLLTQGWSSYNWDDIFNGSPQFQYPFERGITVKANVNDKTIKNTEAYMVDIANNENGLIIKSDNNQKSFVIENVVLKDGETIHIKEVKKNGRLKTPKLYLQSFPSQVPSLDKEVFTLKPKYNYVSLANLKANEISLGSITDEQVLDEVLIVTQREKARIRAESLSFGGVGNNVEVLTNEDRNAFFSFEEYIRRKGVMVNETRTNVVFFLGRNLRPGGVIPMDIFIDDAYVGKSVPPRFILVRDIDYVVINKTGLGVGFGSTLKGAGGILRVYTGGPEIIGEPTRIQRGQDYDLPLKFASNKKFYVPKYKYYNDEFYLKYGTIEWKPQISSDSEGNFSFNISTPSSVPITLFIEGIANDGSFIFEEKTISLN